MNQNERIERLERRVRALAVALVVAIAAAFVVGVQAQPDTLRVRQITVVDEKGTERIWIGSRGSAGSYTGSVTGVMLFDPRGNERSAYLTGDATGEVFLSLGTEKEYRGVFSVSESGGGRVTLSDENGNVAFLGLQQGRPTVVLQEKLQVVLELPSRR